MAINASLLKWGQVKSSHRCLPLSRIQVGYDASPTVREELAVVLCRFVSGHVDMLQEAIQLQQRKLADMMPSYR